MWRICRTIRADDLKVNFGKQFGRERIIRLLSLMACGLEFRAARQFFPPARASPAAPSVYPALTVTLEAQCRNHHRGRECADDDLHIPLQLRLLRDLFHRDLRLRSRLANHLNSERLCSRTHPRTNSQRYSAKIPGGVLFGRSQTLCRRNLPQWRD